MNCEIKKTKISVDKINSSVKGLIPINIKFNFKIKKIVPFQIDGQFPTFISKLNEEDEEIKSQNMKLGDYVIEINGQNVSRASFKSVQKLINKCLNSEETLKMLVYRNTNKNLNNSTNTTIQQSKSIFSCFKKVLSFKTNQSKKHSNQTSSAEITNKTESTTLTNTNNYYTTKKVDNNEDTEDYGYYSIPQDSRRSTESTNSQLVIDDCCKSANESSCIINQTLLDENIKSSIELFISKLQNLIEIYIRPLIALNILNKKEYLILFQNMEKLVPVSKYLLNVIQTNDYTNSLKIVFETFETYLLGLPNAIQLLQDLLAYHEEFYLFLKTLKDSCKIILFDFIFLPFKFVKLMCSYFDEKRELENDDGLTKLNKTLVITMNLLNEISKNNENTIIESTINSTIFTENSFYMNNNSSTEIIFQDTIKFQSNNNQWKKAKIVLYSNKIVILNKQTKKVYKRIKLNNIKLIKNCLNSNLDIDLVINEKSNIKVHFSNMLSKNIWFQLTQIQLNYYN